MSIVIIENVVYAPVAQKLPQKLSTNPSPDGGMSAPAISGRVVRYIMVKSKFLPCKITPTITTISIQAR